MGAVMMGQVIIQEKMPTEHAYLEKIYNSPKELSYDPDKMLTYLNDLPRMSFEEVNQAVRMIYNISNYIVSEAIERHYLQLENQKLTKELTYYSAGLQKETMTNHKPAPDLEESILKPAIDYIHQNLNENVSLKQASKMCFISPSYFSRLFSKEVGEIALELGFNDQSYFIKQFKINEGTTPAVFRRDTSKNTKNHKIIIE